jgi:hypothetical protein
LGFPLNQLNQSNPELWKEKGIFMGHICLTHPPQYKMEVERKRTPNSAPPFRTGRKGKEAWEMGASLSTFVVSFVSLCAAFWEDFLSVSSEDDTSSSLAETVELSDNLCTLGTSSACN